MVMITGNDNIMTAVMKLCKGNPGAVTACAKMANRGSGINVEDLVKQVCARLPDFNAGIE